MPVSAAVSERRLACVAHAVEERHASAVATDRLDLPRIGRAGEVDVGLHPERPGRVREPDPVPARRGGDHPRARCASSSAELGEGDAGLEASRDLLRLQLPGRRFAPTSRDSSCDGSRECAGRRVQCGPCASRTRSRVIVPSTLVSTGLPPRRSVFIWRVKAPDGRLVAAVEDQPFLRVAIRSPLPSGGSGAVRPCGGDSQLLARMKSEHTPSLTRSPST